MDKNKIIKYLRERQQYWDHVRVTTNFVKESEKAQHKYNCYKVVIYDIRNQIKKENT